ncbi:MAG: rhodanese-like domain-containing protein [Pyrinomonadaceae bacterium]
MRLFILTSAALAFAILVLAGCNSADHANTNASSLPAQTAQNTPGDPARRITPVEAKEALDKGEAIVVDVRSEASYEAAHVKGAILIPTTEILSHLDKLPRDKTIITYCS